MGLVTNVFWSCPGCGSKEQAHGDCDDPDEFTVSGLCS